MRLKRGIQRGSCDFCYKRKIKCDRLIRTTQGHSACSHCDIRHVLCRLDDSDDVRIQNKRRPQEDMSPSNLSHAKSDGASIQSCDIRSREPPRVVLQSCITAQPTIPLIQYDSTPSSSNAPPLLEKTILSDETSRTDAQILDELLGLSSDSAFFLDQIFAADCQQSTDWAETVSDNSTQAINTMSPGFDTQSTGARGLDFSAHDPSLYVDPATFESALHSYFDIAACSLPLLFEDTFWEDYRSGRCSRSFSCAVACRGVPFTATPDAWAIQQRLAHQFRDAFLEAYGRVDSQGSIRLDDLEALALMVGFEYDPEYGSPIPSHLARLLLGHDSLVMMTLQSDIKIYSTGNSTSSTTTTTTTTTRSMLSRAAERRTLLFWHVYGLDAFHSLDRQTISRIQDDDTEMMERMSGSQVEGYLDSVLALAVLARKITQGLCNSSTRRLGIKSEKLHLLYEDLRRWRTCSCPPHLSDHAAFPLGQLTGYVDLHYAVLRLLEYNCYLQIENCVAKFGIRDFDTLEGEIVGLRVESESLRAAHGVMEVSQWAKESKLGGKSNVSHSIIDSEPRILRNICAGACFWLCERGLAQPRLNSPYLNAGAGPKLGSDEMNLNIRHRQNHIDAANRLRDAVRTAKSHKDTAGLLAKLDVQLESLNNLMGPLT